MPIIGRFGIINMHTMTQSELGNSTNEVDFLDLLIDKPISSTNIEVNLNALAKQISIGGWPQNIGLNEEDAIVNNSNYLELLCEADVSRVANVRRDPTKVRRLMHSLSRNIATEVTLNSLVADVNGTAGNLAKDTVIDYLATLQRLMVLDNLPAWNTHIRSSAILRKAPKRHLADVALACAACEIDSTKLLNDLEYFGLIYESLVIHDLKVFAESIGAKLYHYRDSDGLEVDVVLEKRNGEWAMFEIKLGFGQVDLAAESLKKAASKVNTDFVGQPLALVVIPAFGFAHTRKDGIKVAPFSTLHI